MSDNQTKKSRRFTFTVFDYQRNYEEFVEIAKSLEKHHFIAFCLEVCPDTGRPHLHGYIEFKIGQRFFALHKYLPFKKEDGLPNKFHIEIAMGTYQDNQKYLNKDGDYHEYGEPSFQGKRTDMMDIKAEIKENPKDLNRIIDERANNLQQLKYAQAIQPIYLDHRNPNEPPTVYWLFGPTGVGKTSRVYNTFTDICSVSSPRWAGTGYAQNECLLFDDFRPGDLPSTNS